MDIIKRPTLGYQSRYLSVRQVLMEKFYFLSSAFNTMDLMPSSCVRHCVLGGCCSSRHCMVGTVQPPFTLNLPTSSTVFVTA